jgi:hypothetical protein
MKLAPGDPWADQFLPKDPATSYVCILVDKKLWSC